MPHFYIDALDADGGSAFVALRDSGPDLEMAETPSPAWVITAPDFEPVPVTSRAIGLAATARGFQPGLSLDGETEVPFTTLAALADFVRRAYLAGGGPDDTGPEGTPPSPPPPPPETGPDEGPRDGPPPKDGERPPGLTDLLLSYAQTLNEQSAPLNHRSLETHAPLTSPYAGLPDAFDGYGESAIGLMQDALALIGQAIGERERVPADRTLWLTHIQGFAHLRPLFAFNPQLTAQIDDQLTQLARIDPDTPLPSAAYDPLELLSTLPIPAAIAGEANWTSLANLFYATLASPLHLLFWPYKRDRCALLLLAAFLLTAGGAMAPVAGTGADRKALLDIRIRDLLAWLDRQMPTHAFDKQIEDHFLNQGKRS